MDNNQSDSSQDFSESRTFKDYLILIRNNLTAVLVILIASVLISVFYAVTAKNIYRAETIIKISKPGGNILQSPLIPEINDYGNDRFIANEIEILKSYKLRSSVANILIDTISHMPDLTNYPVLFKDESAFNDKKVTFTVPELAGNLGYKVGIEQKRGLDIIVITAESQSPKEAALISNIYAKEYRNYNLEINRNQLTFIKDFLQTQLKEKKEELNDAEELLRSYQEKGGIISLDQQAESLIQQLAQFEAQLNAAKIELSASDEVLTKYKEELAKQDPKLAQYLESATSETYITALQNQISELQIKKDLVLATADPNLDIKAQIRDYDLKIAELKSKLDEKIKILKSGIMASSPEEVRGLSQKIIEEEVKNKSLRSTLTSLDSIVRRYEQRFNKLPKTSLELARFQRQRESLEKLYTLVEQKYQEALINEQSEPGNVLIIDDARIPEVPSKPNRMMIVFVGMIIGFGLSLGFVFLKNYFDTTIKSPLDIEKRNLNVLAWIPQIEGMGVNGNHKFDFIISSSPDSIPSEAFRALRTRVQFSRPDRNSLKTILVTSPAPQEGKTTVALNLAGAFAHANKKTLLVDCDLRKPRVHHVFQRQKTPGLVDYLVGDLKFDQVTNSTDLNNLTVITSGTIPPNPAEMLDSSQMEEFLKMVRTNYDYIILDSPPIVAVTDAEILAKKVDGSIMVLSADVSEIAMFERATELLMHDNSILIGTVLNNFIAKPGYRNYYKYYYYYSSPAKE